MTYTRGRTESHKESATSFGEMLQSFTDHERCEHGKRIDGELHIPGSNQRYLENLFRFLSTV